MRLTVAMIILTALLPAFQPAAAADFITEAPEGKAVEYYADFLNFDNTVGFMDDYHTPQKLIFADDGSVYFPNLLLRHTMQAYVRGIYDRYASTITVEPGQQVFYFPNENIPVALYVLDAKGNAGETPSEFYDEPLVFDVSEDGVLSLRHSDRYPMFGVCNANASDEVYQNARNLVFTPVENVKDSMKHFNYSYSYDEETITTTASGYRDGDDVIWLKGLDPKFPNAWIRLIRNGSTFAAMSFQVVFYFANEDPIVFAALQGQNVLNYLPVTVGETDFTITAASDGNTFGNITPDGSGGFEIYQTYSSLSLSSGTFAAAKPAAPSFAGYSEPNSSNETEFIFDSYPKDTDGNLLLKDNLSFRMFVDGKPYTFTSKEYSWISEDMALVPYTFDNYNFFSQGGTDKQRRYVYLRDIPSDVRTIGVELVYKTDGQELVSDRLTYDIAAGKADISGIKDIEADDNAVEATYYNLQGMRVDNPAGGIYIVRRGNAISKEHIR